LKPAPEHPERLAFLGTPAMSVPFLQGLHDAGWPIELVVSRPDRRRRRNADPEPSPVKALALELGLPTSDDPADVADSGADLGVVVAYGRIIKPELLARVPMVNVHFSLLPRWRGAAPVERAILAGDDRTGVDVMVVEEGLDTGGVYARRETEIGDHDTLSALATTLVDLGVELLVDTLRAGLRDPRPQEGEPTYAEKIDPAELQIDWTKPTLEIHRLVRLERAWTTFRGRRLKVLHGHPLPGDLPPGEMDTDLPVEVGTGQGTFRLDEVQPEGKAPMSAEAWASGARIEPGERLGEDDG
jgi:methionyl-tRNA formyltransferase